MDELGLLNTSPGGDEQSQRLLENLNREQATLGNLAPGQRFSLADQGKSIKAIFDAAGDDDDEDFFKEFDVEDLDIEVPVNTKKPLRTLTSGTSEGRHQAAGDVEAAEADDGLPKEGPATPEHPHTDAEQSAAAAVTGPPGEPEPAPAMQEGPLSETPQDTTHADTDTVMQEADAEAKKPAQGAADTEMADLDAPMSAQDGYPAPDQASQQTPGDILPAEAASTDTARPLQQQAGEPQVVLGTDSTGELPAKAGPETVLGGHSGMRQTAQVRSASAGSVPNGCSGMPSAMLAETKAAHMHSPAAGILSKAAYGESKAAAAVLPETAPMQHAAMEGSTEAADSLTQQSQLPSASADLSSKAPTTAALLTTDRPATLPDRSTHQQQQQVQMPSKGATGQNQQPQNAEGVPELPAATAAAPKTAAHAVLAARAGQPGHYGAAQLGNPAITPPLQARLFPPPVAAPPGKAPARVLPMPRTTLPRLPQIIRPRAPARPQLPGHAVTAGAKPPAPSAIPSPTAGMDGVVTPVPSTWAGTPTGSGIARCGSQPSQSLQEPVEATVNATATPAALPTPISGAPSTQHMELCQTPADAIQGTLGTLGNVGKASGMTPATGSEALPPAAAAPHGHGEGSLGARGNLSSPEPPGVTHMPQAKEFCSQSAVNLELLRGQHQLERLIMEAQRMSDQALELKVMAAIVGNRVTRLNSPLLAAKLQELQRRAEQLLKPED